MKIFRFFLQLSPESAGKNNDSDNICSPVYRYDSLYPPLSLHNNASKRGIAGG